MSYENKSLFRNEVGNAIDNLLPVQEGRELEFRLGNYTDSEFVPGQNIVQFKRIIEYLQGLNYELSQTDSLDIIINDLRLTIGGKENIQKFCFNDQIDDLDSVKYMRKTTEKKHEIEPYRLRAQRSHEDQDIKEDERDQLVGDLQDLTRDKFYRYKRRYTFEKHNSPIRYDLTLVKESKGNSFRESHVLAKKERYEVEVELTNVDIEKEVMIDTFTNSLYPVLLKSQSSNISALITETEQNEIFNEYRELVFQETGSVSQQNRQNYFIGIDVLPLKRNHLHEGGDKYILNSSYSVTDKADGDRYLMFISGKGNIYLINKKMDIKNTGLSATDSDLFGSILDGELVELKEGGTRYLIFDCLFLNAEDIRGLPLGAEEEEGGKKKKKKKKKEKEKEKEEEKKTRYEHLKKVAKKLDGNLAYNAPGINMTIGHKTYYFGSGSKLLQEGARQINEKYEVYPYHLDGIIFTPSEESIIEKGRDKESIKGYPVKILGQKISWPGLLKWKPVEQISIDFRVIFNGPVQDSSQPVLLQVQFKGIHETFKETLLNIDNDGEARTSEGDIIYDRSVVEFIYDKENDRWIPIRFRADKTEIGLANARRTARDTWDLIRAPVERDMINGISDVTEEDLPYFGEDQGGLKRLTKPMRSFNRRFIEYLLKYSVKDLKLKSGQGKLLELAAGRAADLNRWHQAKIGSVIGIEYDENAIKEAKTRWADHKKKKKSFPKSFKIVQGDLTRDVLDGDSQNDIERKEVLNDKETDFDIVSCQFAIHYFMENKETFSQFLGTVTKYLKLDGLFIGTTLDGKKVYDKLKESSDGKLSGEKNGHKIWRLTREYPDDQEFSDFGQKISAFNISIGAHSEYLVNFKAMINLCEIHGFELVDIKSFKEETELVEKETQKHHDALSEAEKEYSFLNSYFIFRKK